MASIAAIYDLLTEVRIYNGLSSIYIDKMMHPVPQVEVIQREAYLIEAARGRCVLDIGASGPMSEAIRKVAREYHSISIDGAEWQIDLDKAESLPAIPGLELVIAGEVIEHLSNAGRFLNLLKDYDAPIILTTPNAYGAVGQSYIQRGIENVNPEHVSWYSYHTLKVLIERHGYQVIDWYWYNGKPFTAEGLIFSIMAEACNA